MVAKTRLALIALSALVIGIAFTLCGIMLFFTQNFQQTSSNSYVGTAGFVFGTSVNLIQENTEFKVVLNNLDCKAGNAKAEINLNIVCEESGENDYFYNEELIYFLLQVPYEIDHVTVDYYARTPEFYGGSVDYYTFNDSVSYVLVQIPKRNGNFSFGENRNFRFCFDMKNVFIRSGQCTYEMDVTFSSNFDYGIITTDSLEEIASCSKTAVFRWSKKAELYVVEPIPLFPFDQVKPISDGIHVIDGEREYSWDIESIATGVGSDSVILTFQDIIMSELVLNRNNFMWFSLGLGIPLFISSVFEFLREITGLRKVYEEKTLFVILMVFNLFIIMVLHVVFFALSI